MKIKSLLYFLVLCVFYANVVTGQTQSFKLSGMVKDKVTNQPLSVDIFLLDAYTDEIIKKFKSDTTGRYSVILEREGRYSIEIAHKKGYIYYSETFRISQKEKEKIIHIKLKSLIRVHHSPPYFNYDMNSTIIKKEHLPTLNKIIEVLKINPKIRVKINGHTDNLETEKLSTKRAKVVYDFFISKGIDKSRLSYKGYGMKYPMVHTFKEHKLNRRVDFILIEID